MASARAVVFLFPYIFFVYCFVAVVKCDDDDGLAILHASSGSNSEDFCVGYNSMWKSIPDKLEDAPALVAVEAVPPELCEPASDKVSLKGKAVGIKRRNCTFYTKGKNAQDAGAREVIIISRDHLISPSANSSREYGDINIPMAVIIDDDWKTLMDLGDEVHVQLYSPVQYLFDFNLILIFACAIFTVVVGAYWSGISRIPKPVELEEQNDLMENQPSTNYDIEITPVMVIIFVIMTCASLLLMYFFYNYLVYFVIALFALASCNGLFECLCPTIGLMPFGHCKVPPNRLPVLKHQPEIRYILLLFFCLGVSIWWVIMRHASYAWVLQDILGMAFCISLIKNIRLGSLKVCALLLILLLIYDVFFVFITPLFSAKESIMVKVATGGGNKEQIPMVIKIPKLTMSTLAVCDRPYSLLGFGDILVPGLYVAYCHWFDIRKKTPRKLYFVFVSIAYGAGLLVTFAALYLMKQGQPALVYLVPFTLTTGVIIALVRKEFNEFWTGKTGIEYHETNNVDEEEVIFEKTDDSPGSDETRTLLCR